MNAFIELLLAIGRALGIIPKETTPEAPKPDPTKPAPPEAVAIKFPKGPIKTRGPKGQNLGSWDNLARWEPQITNAVKEQGNAFGPLLLACFSVVETGGNHYTTGKMTGTASQVVKGGGNPPSLGLLQIVCGYHGKVVPGADCMTPEGQWRIGAKLLTQWIRETGNWEAALSTRWHPGTDPGSGYTPGTYIDTVRKLIAEVKATWPQTPPTTPPPTRVNPFPKPIIYDLSTDYGMYGITASEARKIITSRFENRDGGKPRYIVNHIQDGTTPGSLQWWARGPGVQASSTVMANRDGSILRIVPEQHGPWTNGDTCKPTAKSAGLRALGGNPNIWSLTLEGEGKPGVNEVTYTDAQLTAICWQFADWMIRDNIPLANVLSHASINQCDRPTCPGDANQLAVLAKLKEAGFA